MNLAPSSPARLAFILFAALSLGGCQFWRDSPLELGPGLTQLPGVAALATSDLNGPAFASAFPEVTTFRLSSRVMAQRYRLFGKVLIDFSMLVSGREKLRIAGRHPGDGATLFDMVADGKNMRVYVPPARALFEGDSGPEGSPFGIAYGVEPEDLVPLILIGREIARGSWRSEDGKHKVALVAAEGAEGLVRVELEKASGLPRRALWRRGKSEWNVEYREWDAFGTAKEGPKQWPMPVRMVVTRKRPYARIEIRRRPRGEDAQYLVNPEISPRAFLLPIPQGTEPRSLEDLGRALGGK